MATIPFHQILIFSVVIAFFVSGVLYFLYRQMKNHPVSGTIIGKFKKEKFFVLIVEDSKKRRVNITTDEATWSKAQWGDPYTAQKTDWYLFSEN